MRCINILKRPISILSIISGFIIFPAQGQEVKIEKKDDVVVIQNPGKPVVIQGVPASLTLNKDLQIGIESGDENYMFSQLNSIQVSENEEIIAYDGQVPTHFPVFENFICGDDGRIYVRTYERDDEENVIYDVFDPEGRFFTQFALPFEEKVTVVKKDKLYCIILGDKKGIPLVKRYKMSWN